MVYNISVKRKYGRLMEKVTGCDGREIHLYLNCYKHIMIYHDKLEIWVKHWRDIIRKEKPEKKFNALHYRKTVEGGYLFEIIVVEEKGVFLIKTAIISKGEITSFRRIRNV